MEKIELGNGWSCDHMMRFYYSPPGPKDKKKRFKKWLRQTIKEAEEYKNSLAEMELSNCEAARRYLDMLEATLVDTLDEMEGKL